MYHSVGKPHTGDTYGLTTSASGFDEQLRLIQSLGLSVVPVTKQAVCTLSDRASQIGITFDDGFEDNIGAAEILERYNYPFSIYMIASQIGKPGFLNANQLRELSKSKNCTIGAHGLSHQPMGAMNSKNQSFELVSSKAILEDALGMQVDTMSLPHGSLNRRTQELGQRAGFDLICSSRPGLNSHTDLNIFHLRRTEVRPAHTANTFCNLLFGSQDWKQWIYFGRAIAPLARSQWRPYRPFLD